MIWLGAILATSVRASGRGGRFAAAMGEAGVDPHVEGGIALFKNA